MQPLTVPVAPELRRNDMGPMDPGLPARRSMPTMVAVVVAAVVALGLAFAWPW